MGCPIVGSHILISLVSLAMLRDVESRAAEPNPIFSHLTGQGVPFAADRHVVLPAPTLADDLSAADQQRALVQVADANHPLSALLRKAVVAPFVLKISDEEPSAGAAPRRVDLWFVTYGDLAATSSDTFIKQQIDGAVPSDERAGAGQGAVLTNEELAARKIVPDPDERFLAADVKLFDRVHLSGVMRARLTRQPQSVTLAAVLDSRFAEDPKYPNRWTSLARDEAGKVTEGQPHAYSAAGWYCKATQLVEPAGAILVEYHLVFDEPAGWFHGANLLRSKLPILVQDAVRNFRRKVSEQAKSG